MDFVDILITIGLIIYIFAALRKKKRAARKTDAPAKTGWLGKLEGFIEDVRKEMEQAAAEEEQPDRQSQAYMDEMEPMEDDIPDFFAKESPRQTPPPLPCEETCRHEEPYPEQEILAPQAIEPLPHMKGKKVCKKRTRVQKRERTISRKGLQKAVIWSEILSPPIALKNPLK